MSFNEIKEFLQPGLQEVNALMDQALGSDVPLLDSTNASLRSHKGKMMRPMLTLLAAGAAASVSEDTCRYAAAVELLHNATLLHDDVVDKAGERRGLPTVFNLLGGGPAVLMGDYWLVKSLKLIMGSREGWARVLDLFAGTLGHLTEGELLQMEKASKADTTEDDYLRIIYGKTASLFETAALSGAISAKADEAVIQALGAFGRNIGTAFQIKDDIMDYATSQEALGKPVGIDLLEQKITQPLLCALEEVSPDEALRIRVIVAGISDNPASAEEVKSFVQHHHGVEKAVEVMEKYLKNAVSCLDVLEESEEKSYLSELASFVGQRNL